MANNEYVNKVVFGDTTIMDISDTTAEAGDVVVGKTFYAKSGAQTTGTLDDATQSTHGLMSATDKTKLDGLTSMVVLSYGSSTWQDFITAYNNNAVVYCRASSNSNPASGSQTRMAFMAYVNNATNPNNVEFQYYRSMSSHSATAMGDEVYIYKLTDSNGGTWSVTTRKASIKEIAVASGSKLGISWSSDKVTLSNTMTADDMPMSSSDSTTTKAAIEAKYSKPSGGIPATDLADTYLTAHQDISGKANSADLATVATTGDYDDLINKPTIPIIPTNISSFTNDAGYLTSHQDISGKVSGPSSASDTNVALFDGTTGKLIKDSGFTIETSVPANAVFTDTTYNVITGATSSAAGTSGLVPAPLSGDENKFLKGDGTWASVAIDASNFVTLDTNQTISGIKIFTNSVDIKNHLNNPYINFYSNENNNPGGAIQLAGARDGAANYATGQFKFIHYAPSSDSTSILGTSESYVLPPATPGLESSASYYIYTTKNVSAGNNISITGGSGSSNITIAANIPVMAFATTDVNGTSGLVPAPSSGDQNLVFSQKGWFSDSALYRGDIPNNGNLNDYIHGYQGIWRITSNVGAATITNIPEAKAGILQVITGYTTSWVIQIYYRYDVGSYFWLRRLNSDGTDYAWKKYKSIDSLTKSDIDLGNVDNKSSATIRGEITKANVTNALGYTPASIVNSNTYDVTNYLDDGNGNDDIIPISVKQISIAKGVTTSLGKLRNGSIIFVAQSSGGLDICYKSASTTVYKWTSNNNFTIGKPGSHEVTITNNESSVTLYVSIIS